MRQGSAGNAQSARCSPCLRRRSAAIRSIHASRGVLRVEIRTVEVKGKTFDHPWKEPPAPIGPCVRLWRPDRDVEQQGVAVKVGVPLPHEWVRHGEPYERNVRLLIMKSHSAGKSAASPSPDENNRPSPDAKSTVHKLATLLHIFNVKFVPKSCSTNQSRRIERC